MKLPNLTIPPGLEDAYALIIRPQGGTNPDTVIMKKLSPARRLFKTFSARSYLVQLHPFWLTLSSSEKMQWQVAWGGWPGSGYSQFLIENAPLWKTGQDLKRVP